MPRPTLPHLLAIVACALPAACGGDEAPPDRPAGAPAVARTPAAQQPELVATDGRLGGAVTAESGGPESVLDQGGPFPDEIFENPTDETGVAGSRTCRNPDLVPVRGNLRRVVRATFCLMNAERRRAGVPSLRRNRLLARASVRHSRDMVRGRYFAHVAPSGSRLRDRLRRVRYIPRRGRWIVGENLAWGAGAVAAPRAIVRAWMASPGHRRNLLSPRYSAVGLGIVIGTPRGPGGGAVYTTDFGRRG